MKPLFNVYRVLAFVVGVLLIVMVFIGMPLKYFLSEGSSAQNVGVDIVSVVGVTHGMLYLVYVVTAFFLAVRARWSVGFTVLALAAGVIPVLIFWVEHQVARKMHADHPDLFTPARVRAGASG